MSATRSRIYFGGLSGPTMPKASIRSYLRDGHAAPLLTVYRFRILLCCVWFPGYQFLGKSYIVTIIPGLAFEWRGGYY